MGGRHSLQTVGRALRFRHWLVWGTAIGAAVLALGASVVRHPTYEATTVLSLNEAQKANQGFDVAMQADQFLSQSFISLATSRPVLEQVCAVEGEGCDPVALARVVRASTPKATGQIEVTADSSSAEQAARLANDVSNELVMRNQAQVDGALAPQRTYLEAQLKQIQDRIDATQQSISSAESSGRSEAAVSNAISPLISQLNLLQGQYTSIYSRLQDLAVLQAQESSTLSIYQPATVPASPVDPSPLRYGLVGLAGGLVAGFLFALLAERARDSIEDGTDLADATGSALVLELGGRRGRAGAGTYGYLAHASLLGREGGAPAIMLVAASPRDDVNEVALDLAGAVAQAHRSVLVLQASGRGPDGGQGEAGPHEAPDGGSRAVVVRTGPAAGAANGHRSGGPEEFDLTISCALAPMDDPGAAWLRPAADVAIIVATRGRTRFSQARQTAEQLRLVGIRTVAAVLRDRPSVPRRPGASGPRRRPAAAPTPTAGGTETRAVETVRAAPGADAGRLAAGAAKAVPGEPAPAPAKDGGAGGSEAAERPVDSEVPSQP